MLNYDKYIVAFSGGKDCTAAFLHLLEIGVPREKIELWHHDIDGREKAFMDWRCTPAYCRAFAAAFGVPIYFSWREGGFKREMLRNDAATARTWFQVPQEEWYETKKRRKATHADDGMYIVVGGDGPLGTRLKFPQVSADLSVRWCSAYLKIMVMETGIRNQARFKGLRTLVISGERAEESAARAKYKEFEPDRADARDGRLGRLVDRWRPVHLWTEKQVWEIIERWGVRVHPAYYLGFGRVSCMFCIFGNANQFATANFLAPEQGADIIDYEEQFGVTIKRDKSVRQLLLDDFWLKIWQRRHLSRALVPVNHYQNMLPGNPDSFIPQLGTRYIVSMDPAFNDMLARKAVVMRFNKDGTVDYLP